MTENEMGVLKLRDTKKSFIEVSKNIKKLFSLDWSILYQVGILGDVDVASKMYGGLSQ